MSRHLVIVSVVGVLAIVTIQQFADGDTEADIAVAADRVVDGFDGLVVVARVGLVVGVGRCV